MKYSESLIEKGVAYAAGILTGQAVFTEKGIVWVPLLLGIIWILLPPTPKKKGENK